VSNSTLPLTPRLYDYLLQVSLREPDVLRRLREETAAHPRANMQIAPEQGQFMAWLVRALGARRALEVGVFTGYSALAVALALPDEGHLTACDVSEEFTATARRYWDEAGVSQKITLRLAPAVETLDALLAEGSADQYDFAFIDADKDGYITYFERALALVRPGGLIAVDNVLRRGLVADPAARDAETLAIRAFNEHVRHDTRVELTLLPIADGLTLLRRV
jgi:predicted O-methyltransferase YrrM